MGRTGLRIGKYGIVIRDDGVIEFHDLRALGVLTAPPYDTEVFWMGALGEILEDLAISTTTIARITVLDYADVAVELRMHTYLDHTFVRHVDYQNWYAVMFDDTQATADHQIRKSVAGTVTTLATEAVDLVRQWYWVKFQAVGTTLSSFRAPDPVSPPPATPTLTATDADIATGRVGARHIGHGLSGLSGIYWFVRVPTSDVPRARKFYVVDLDGEGTEDEPFVPRVPVDVRVVERLEVYDKRGYEMLLRLVGGGAESVKPRGVVGRLRALVAGVARGGLSRDQVDVIAEALGFIRRWHRVNRKAAVWSVAVPTPGGQLVDSVAVLRVFDAAPGFVDDMPVLGAREVDPETAVREVRRLDDRLHEYDLVPCRAKDEDDLERCAREYVEWRESQFKCHMDLEIAKHYVGMRKGWL